MLELGLIITYTLLIIAMGATVFLQKTTDRVIVSFIFTFTILGFDFISHLIEVPEFYYYIAGGILDLGVILVISNLNTTCRLSDDLLKISFISLAYNSVGFYLLNEDYDNTVYRIMCLLLYAWAFWVLIRGEPKDARSYQGNSWLYSLRFNADPRHYLNNPK